jgi:hypothetical protein
MVVAQGPRALPVATIVCMLMVLLTHVSLSVELLHCATTSLSGFDTVWFAEQALRRQQGRGWDSGTVWRRKLCAWTETGGQPSEAMLIPTQFSS